MGTDLNACMCKISYVIAHFNLIFVTGQIAGFSFGSGSHVL